MSFLRADPLRTAAEQALNALAEGASGDAVESDRVDCKADPSILDRHGDTLAPMPDRSEKAAELLADAAACMANSGGGVLIVGVDDKTGRPAGTGLDASWLRGRIHDLGERRLSCAIEEASLTGTRLLVIIAPGAQEPIRVRGKAKHRVNCRCVEIDASLWMANHLHRLGYDWSARSSTVSVDDVRPAAVEVARRYLRESGEDNAATLASAEQPELLRRLTVVDPHGMLTNAGGLLLSARADEVLIDYRRREHPSGDSLLRLDRSDVSLLEVLQEIEQATAQANRVVHVPGTGLAVAQIRAIPPNTLREALANAIAHRDWSLPEPITVESVGDTLTVQSPGGFTEGVDAEHLLTTPARTRNPHLADLLRRLRIAEREGIGVDRMYRELIRIGHPPPEITELAGPHIRCVLLGGDPDPTVLRLMTNLEPATRFDDVDIALLVDVLRTAPTVTGAALAKVLQKQPQEAAAVLSRAESTFFRGQSIVVRTTRTRRYRQPEYRFSDVVREHFGRELPYHRNSREDVIPHVIDFVRRHGRIQSSDYAELFDVSQPYASTVLRDLASEDGGLFLEPGREPNVGRNAHYVAGPGSPENPEHG